MAGAVAVVLVAVTVIAVVATRGGAGSTGSATTTANTADANLLQKVTGVDAAVIEQVGSAGLPNRFYAMQGAPPLTGGGKPQVLYIGADYCPYCAAQRWSMVVALSRFGSFSHIGLTSSGSADVYPDTATFSFSGVQYSSRYLDFAAVEMQDREGKPKDAISDAQKQLLATWDVPPYVPANAAGGVPWVDVGGQYAMVSSGFTPQILAGLDQNQIADRLSNPKDLVTQGIVGNAANITAAICKGTGMQPAAVCTTAPVAQIAAQMP